MKLRATLLCLVLLACAAVPALAQYPIDIPGQLGLAWGDCMPSGAPYISLDCQNPSAIDQLFASLTSGADIPGVIADLGIVDVTAGLDPGTLPPFWDFHAGGCSGPLNIIFDANFLGMSSCNDLWGGTAGTGGQYGGQSTPIPVGNRARIKWTSNIDPALAIPLPAGQPQYIEKILFRHNALSSCPGCQEPVCFVYNEELISDISGQTFRITNPGYATANTTPTAFNCPGSTPSKSSTWGGVKALYK